MRENQFKRQIKQILSFVLVLAMVITLMPVSNLTVYAGGESGISYKSPVYNTTDEPKSGLKTWEDKTANCEKITTDTTALSAGWYVVNSDVTISSSLTVTGAVNIILVDGYTLTVSGIVVTGASNSLTIYGQSAGTGMIESTGTEDGSNGGSAGIGGSSGNNGNNITINGGTINATGASAFCSAAGIGGGATGVGSNIVINGGTVTATGGNGHGGGAGIGTGYHGQTDDGEIIINGGTVIANGGSSSSGIGCGDNGLPGNIYINGGTVTAVGNGNCGISAYSKTIAISGGTVTATGGSGSAGIGSSYGHPDITISGGTITATGNAGGAGIGGSSGYYMNSITISDGDITATGGDSGPGIGNGNGASESCTLTIDSSMQVKAGSSADPTEVISSPTVTSLADKQYVKICSTIHKHDGITFDKVLTADGGALTTGNYYLTEDITLTNNITIARMNKVYICLNGHVLKGNGNGSVITNNGGRLFIYDCNSSALTHYYTVGSDGVWTWNDSNTSSATSINDLTSIPTTGSVVSISGGAITGGNNIYGGGINIENPGTGEGWLYFYGGNVVGNKALATSGESAYGGGICSDYYISMDGGTVCGNAVGGDTGTSYNNFGGGVYSYGDTIIEGGTIAFNKASGDNDDCTGWGGGISIYYDEGIIISNANIKYNYSDYAGGIYNEGGNSYLDITSCNILQNKAEYWGGGIYNYGSYLTITDSSIKQNKAGQWAGGIYSYGPQLSLKGETTIQSNTSASDSPSGGVYVWIGDGENDRSKVYINGKVIIKDNKTTYNGKTINANLCLDGETETQKVTIESDDVLTGSDIGITTMLNTVVGGYVFANDATEVKATEDKQYFTSDDSRYTVKTSSADILLSEEYTVNFDANGGTGSTASQTFTVGTAAALSANGFTKDNYTFAGWSTTKDGSVVYHDKEIVKNLATKNGDTVTLYAVWKESAKRYSIDVTVDSAFSDNVKLELKKGNTSFAIKDNLAMTGTDPSYSASYEFTNILPGTYNVIATQTVSSKSKTITITEAVVITDSGKSVTVTLPSGDTNSVLEVTNNETPDIVVGGLSDEADTVADDNSGKAVEVKMTAEEKEESTATGSAQIKEKAAANETLEYFDFSITKTIWSLTSGTRSASPDSTDAMHTTSNVLSLLVPYDTNGKAARDIKVYRYHDEGTAETIAFTRLTELSESPADGTYYVDTDNGIVYIFACKFSTYAIGYADSSADTIKIDTPATTTLTEKNQTLTLTATITPATSTDTIKTWTSSNPSVMTVDSTGKVTAVAEGTATVTVTTVNGLTDSIDLTVKYSTSSDDSKSNDDSSSDDSTPTDDSTSTTASNTIALNAGFKVSQTGKSITIKWGKVKDADGYIVYATYCGSFKYEKVKTVKSSNVTKVKITKLHKKALNLKKNYKIYVVAYKLDGTTKKVIAKSIKAHIVGRKNTTYTNVKEIKLKKNTYTLNVGKTAKIKATTVLVDSKKLQLTDDHTKEFRYASTDTSVATVSKSGKITAVSSGTATIYVYSRNGYAKKVKVTVK